MMNWEVRYKLAAIVLIILAVIFWAADKSAGAFIAFVVAFALSSLALAEEKKRP
jgi:hypothetical protein